MLLQELTDEEWDRFLDMASERSGHIAALLDREMPPHLVEDAAAAGLDLLPGIGDLEPECSCEAWDHCPHTGALCYQVARLLDQDPFVLLLLRGRGERWLLDELQVRSAARAGRREDDEASAEDAAGGRPRVGCGPMRRTRRGTSCRRCFLPRPCHRSRACRRRWTRRRIRPRGSTLRHWSSWPRTAPYGRSRCWRRHSRRATDSSLWQPG